MLCSVHPLLTDATLSLGPRPSNSSTLSPRALCNRLSRMRLFSLVVRVTASVYFSLSVSREVAKNTQLEQFAVTGRVCREALQPNTIFLFHPSPAVSVGTCATRKTTVRTHIRLEKKAKFQKTYKRQFSSTKRSPTHNQPKPVSLQAKTRFPAPNPVSRPNPAVQPQPCLPAPNPLRAQTGFPARSRLSSRSHSPNLAFQVEILPSSRKSGWAAVSFGLEGEFSWLESGFWAGGWVLPVSSWQTASVINFCLL